MNHPRISRKATTRAMRTPSKRIRFEGIKTLLGPRGSPGQANMTMLNGAYQIANPFRASASGVKDLHALFALLRPVSEFTLSVLRNLPCLSLSRARALCVPPRTCMHPARRCVRCIACERDNVMLLVSLRATCASKRARDPSIFGLTGSSRVDAPHMRQKAAATRSTVLRRTVAPYLSLASKGSCCLQTQRRPSSRSYASTAKARAMQARHFSHAGTVGR
jgi:hypothetical protein